MSLDDLKKVVGGQSWFAPFAKFGIAGMAMGVVSLFAWKQLDMAQDFLDDMRVEVRNLTSSVREQATREGQHDLKDMLRQIAAIESASQQKISDLESRQVELTDSVTRMARSVEQLVVSQAAKNGTTSPVSKDGGQ